MSRREKRINNDNRVMLILGGGIILIGIIAFIISYVIFNNTLQRDSKTIANNEFMSNYANNSVTNVEEQNTQEASSSIGKSVNEVKNSENTTKVAINTKNTEKSNNENTESKNIEKDSQNKEENNITNNDKVEEQVKDPSFLAPVAGEIVKDYAKDNLIYSETLEEWTTHLGIDFKAEKTEVVKAAADGIIKSIKNDPRYGLTVVIEHSNGFESIYANLLSSEFVTVGEEVKQGDSIGTVGNTATFEIADDTHLHFELKQNGNSVDPNIYLR